MKKILIIITFLFVLPVIAQNSKATLHFKTLTWIGKIVKDKVKFKRNDEKTSFIYTKEDLKFFIIRIGSVDTKFYFKKVKGKNGIYLMQLELEGKANLFLITRYYGTNMGVNGSTISGGRSKITYYITKNIDEEDVYKVSSKLFGKPFNRAAARYFKDCFKLAVAIHEKNKGFGRYDILQIVKIYNNECKWIN